MGFPRQEYWSGLPFPSWGNLPDPGIKSASPALAGSHQESLVLRSGNIKNTVRVMTGENPHGDEGQQAGTKAKWQSWDSRKTQLDAEVSEWCYLRVSAESVCDIALPSLSSGWSLWFCLLGLRFWTPGTPDLSPFIPLFLKPFIFLLILY